MNSIINEKPVSFKTLEQETYRSACKDAQERMRERLEAWDASLAKERDKEKYRDKGTRQTTIKTIFGEVTYRRHVYQTITEEGKSAFAYLLDEAMGMERIGCISANLAERIADAVTESSYRAAAEQVSATTGQSVSAQGAWNVLQKIGERIIQEEEAAVREMEADCSRGGKETPVLFEEMDGVWLSMQDRRHKKMKKQEMKVFTMYEGWDRKKEEEGRSSLVGKVMLAGMEKSAQFHEKREACIRKTYNADEIQQRILNGDGGSWIRETYDPDAIFQLDRYHIYREILRKIGDKKAQRKIRRLFEEEKIGEMLEYIRTYAESVADGDKDKRKEKAMELHAYLSNNKEGLLPYQKRGIPIPEAREGILYKAMGVQEGQNCTVITLRMKHRRMRWSPEGANNLAKVLYKKENRDLYETIERFCDGQILVGETRERIETLSAAKAPKKDGKGSPYPDTVRAHVPLMDAMQTAARKALCAALR